MAGGLRLTRSEARRLGIPVPKESLPDRKQNGKSSVQEILTFAVIGRWGSRAVSEYSPIPGRRFRIDLAFPVERLAVEVDGWQYHGKTLSGFRADRDRQNILTMDGWRFLRIPAGDVHRNLLMVIEMIEQALKKEG